MSDTNASLPPLDWHSIGCGHSSALQQRERQLLDALRRLAEVEDDKEHLKAVKAVLQNRLAEVEAANRWISITERLPEMDGTPYLCLYDGGAFSSYHNGMEVMYAASQAFWFGWRDMPVVGIRGFGITHYRLLPPAPSTMNAPEPK